MHSMDSPEVAPADESPKRPEEAYPLPLDPHLATVLAHARDADLRSALAWWRGSPEHVWAEVYLRSGRKEVEIRVEPDEAEALAAFEFKHWIVLDGYHAILDTQRREIVAGVDLNGGCADLREIPGAITFEEQGSYEWTVKVHQIRVTHPSHDLVLELQDNGGSIPGHRAFLAQVHPIKHHPTAQTRSQRPQA